MTRSTRRRWWVFLLVPVLVAIELVIVWLVLAAGVYSPEYVRRVLAWRESDQSDYLHNFPLRSLRPAAEPTPFPVELDGERTRAGLAAVFDIDDLDEFLGGLGTQAFIVIEDGVVRFEGYYNGAERDTMLTSFSVAKSFDSALIGIAIDEGFIADVHDPVTAYLPELGERDPRFHDITIEHLLSMSSGLDYQEMRWALFNGDDPLTTYYTDQRELALERTRIVGPPGELFSYNKYHPQLLGLILERTTGMSVTEYTQTRLWDPLGMEYGGAWALDSDASGFEKMEAGLNARAIDYAKLGALYLDGGEWHGRRIISDGWVSESTSPDLARQRADYYRDDFGQQVYADGSGYYRYMWYGRLRHDNPPDFAAEGDHGQFIYVSPAADLVIVRIGTDVGLPSQDWITAFERYATTLIETNPGP